MSLLSSPLDPDPRQSAADSVSPPLDVAGETDTLLRSDDPGSLRSGADDGRGEVALQARTGFVDATLAELSKVVWPSRQQLFSETVGVILMVGLSAAAIAAIDRFYHWLSVVVFTAS